MNPPELTPDQEEQVRRLLADARHDEPMPPAVTERLDRVLAGLADEPIRRRAMSRLADRRRRATTMLVAAAAVVVVGVGVGQVVGGTGGGGSGSADQAPEAVSGRAADNSVANGPATSAPQSARERDFQQRDAVRVRPDRFAADAARLQELWLARSYSGQDHDGTVSGQATEERQLDAQRTNLCSPGDWGRGVYRPVRYGRAAGYLVFRRPQGDTQVADLFLCGTDEVLRSVTLPRH